MSSTDRGERFLTVDIGNSAVKLALWSRDASGGSCLEARFETTLEQLERVDAWLRGRVRPSGAAASCVARAESRQELAAVLAAHVELPARAPATPELSIECHAPEQVGEDRVFAAVGALHLVGAPAVIVDAGTALTVDVLARGEQPGRGRFLGGAIAPGPTLLARVLSEATARLPRVTPIPDAPALGRDTHAALLAGVGVGFAGAARHLAREVAREAAIEEAPIVLTGGAHAFLLRAFAPREPLVVPELVHIGLLCAGTAERGSPWRVGRHG